MLYFDHNATTPLLPEAKRAWLEAVDSLVGNPSSPHRLGARADAALESARERLAAALGCEPGDIVWTSGATESNNAMFSHLAGLSPGRPDEVLVGIVEHPSVLAPARRHFRETVQTIPVDGRGVVSLDWLEEQLSRQGARAVAVMAANNETGVLQPWREVAALCGSRGVPLLCDATQWIGKLPAAGLSACDFVSGSAHKFGGPRGVGFLKCPSRTAVEPLLSGGKQEDGRRAGTENVAGVLAMVAALEARESALARGSHRERLEWREEFEQALTGEPFGASIIGAGTERLWNTVSAMMPETDCRQRWVVKLDKAGFAVSTGSACASGREEPSHVLAAMGLEAGEAGRVLRFSSGWETTRDDWRKLLAGLREVHGAMLELKPT
jgi:cysteine desulfurase